MGADPSHDGRKRGRGLYTAAQAERRGSFGGPRRRDGAAVRRRRPGPSAAGEHADADLAGGAASFAARLPVPRIRHTTDHARSAAQTSRAAIRVSFVSITTILTIAVLVLVCAVLVIAVRIFGRQRVSVDWVKASERRRGALDPATGARLADGGLTIFDVPNEPDLRLMFGRPDAIRGTGAELVQAVPLGLARVAVGTDALVRGGIEVLSQQGMLVRLTQESTRAFREGRKLYDASGAAMGVVQNSSGKFSHILRFKPAAGGQALTAATGLLSAIAMQAQLASIERAIADVAADVIRVERAQDSLITSEMRAVDGLLRETYDAAMASGELTDVMWDQIMGVALLVRKHEEFSAMQLADITRELAQLKTLKSRRAWLIKNRSRLGERLAAAQHSGILSIQYGALRLWRLTTKDDPSRDYYVSALRDAVKRRDGIVQELLDEFARSIDSANKVSGLANLHSPFDARKVKKLMFEVVENFEAATGMSLADALMTGAPRLEVQAASPPGGRPSALAKVEE